MNIFGNPIGRETIVIFVVAFVFMLIFAAKEILNRRAGGHADYKSLIVSIGVLGTFVGIFLGLWDFNTQDIEGSVPQLLEGLKLAFATSILGMLFSATLAAIERTGSGEFSDEASALSSIDRKLSELSHIAANTASTVEQLQNFRMEVRDEQLKSRQFIEKNFKTTNRSLEKAIETLSEGATGQIVEALNQVIKDFNKNLTEQFGNNFKELNSAVNRLVDWQDKYRDQMEHNRHLLEAISESLRASKDTLFEVANKNEQITAVYRNLEKALHEQNKQLQESEKQLNAQKEMLPHLSNMIQGFETSLEGIATTTSDFSKEIQENVTAQTKTLRILTEELQSQLPQSLSELDRTLAGLTKRFAEDYEAFLTSYQSLARPVN